MILTPTLLRLILIWIGLADAMIVVQAALLIWLIRPARHKGRRYPLRQCVDASTLPATSPTVVAAALKEAVT